MEKLIWQPFSLYQQGHDFGIRLDERFAEDMYSSKLSDKNYQRMQQLPYEYMKFKGEPYIFYQDTCLVKEITLDADRGKWLSIEGRPRFDRPLQYSTHNFDIVTDDSDVLTMMRLFDLWVSYSKFLKD